ncbi:hypothetical protein Cgig2_019126 [Carnegiea gigantea]|uniref:DUF3741 domain-containing protein n=1 Tax=Carnegiea gigantea TaxID=171969 RepID=A0A9Q1JT72_9CARY|nr:hypothetical protein Cgig2_019126 [Carnegiea gigantea]
MATERKRSKGRFLYLFDWNAKSRKKLFSNKTETYEGSIQEKGSADDFEIPHYLLELNENKDHHSFRGSGNYSCASLVNGDDGYGARAPGVVARLMGLDSMPTMPSCEASSLSSYDSRAVNNSYCPRGPAPFPPEHHILEYSYTPDKLGSLPWSSMDPRRSKVNGRRPIERFQEVLPPKSAKPISITHHKLLSPIKSPGFILTKDAAYIMEAAARILDSSPQPTSRAKVPTLGSPSSSFKLQDLKDKIDAAQRSSRLPESSKTPKHSTPVKHSRTNFSGKSSHRSLFKNILGSETSISQKVKNRGKSVSAPVPDKANMQKREGSVYTEDRSQLQKEHKQVKSKQKQSNMQKAEKTRTSGSKSSGALKQNNDKQNSVNHKEKLNYQTPILDQQPGKVALGNNSARPSKVVHKVYVNSENRPKKVVTATSVDDQRTPLNGVIERKPSLNRMKNITRDKQVPISDSQLSEIVRDRGDRRAVQSDLSLQGDSRNDMDVISFTFTSPIKKSSSQSMSSIEDIGSNCHHVGGSPDLNSQSESHTRSSSSPHLGLSLIDSGSLSLLLEKKLKELTAKIVSTKSASGNEGHDTDSASFLSESISSHDVAGSTRVSYDGTSDKDEKSFACGGDCSTALATKSRPKLEDAANGPFTAPYYSRSPFLLIPTHASQLGSPPYLQPHPFLCLAPGPNLDFYFQRDTLTSPPIDVSWFPVVGGQAHGVPKPPLAFYRMLKVLWGMVLATVTNVRPEYLILLISTSLFKNALFQEVVCHPIPLLISLMVSLMWAELL